MHDIRNYSNPDIVFKKAREYLGKDVQIQVSNKPPKKYMVFNPSSSKWIHFGLMPYEDYTKHKDMKRRESYLRRTQNMKGNWRENKYSPNNLSRNILW